jgi:hypothetical protein
MSYKHGGFPCINAQLFLGPEQLLSLPGQRASITSSLFQSYFAARLFGFAVWGKKLANVS